MSIYRLIRSFSRTLIVGVLFLSVSSCKDIKEAEWMVYQEKVCEPWAEGSLTIDYTHHAKEKLLKDYFKEIGVRAYMIELSWMGEPRREGQCAACECLSGTIIECRVRLHDIEVLRELGFEMRSY